VLFRGAAEGHIRKYLIEDRNYIDAIIGLPSNLFYGTGIPTCILVLKKCKTHPDNILFIDASNDFEKVKNQNVLREQDIEKIITTYQNREVIERYSNIATLEEVKINDYNLNIPRYVNTFEEVIEINIDTIAEKLNSVDAKMKDVDNTIASFCTELNIKTPF
jgi:type I restriction enzyme M protein